MQHYGKVSSQRFMLAVITYPYTHHFRSGVIFPFSQMYFSFRSSVIWIFLNFSYKLYFFFLSILFDRYFPFSHTYLYTYIYVLICFNTDIMEYYNHLKYLVIKSIFTHFIMPHWE